MIILSIPRLDVLGCSSPLTWDIGPGLSPHTVGIQGKIGPHTPNLSLEAFIFFEKKKKKLTNLNLIQIKKKKSHLRVGLFV